MRAAGDEETENLIAKVGQAGQVVHLQLMTRSRAPAFLNLRITILDLTLSYSHGLSLNTLPLKWNQMEY